MPLCTRASCGGCGRCTAPWEHDEEGDITEMVYTLTAHIPLKYRLREWPTASTGYAIKAGDFIYILGDVLPHLHVFDGKTLCPAPASAYTLKQRVTS